jgi:hypothetical protein
MYDSFELWFVICWSVISVILLLLAFLGVFVLPACSPCWSRDSSSNNSDSSRSPRGAVFAYLQSAVAVLLLFSLLLDQWALQERWYTARRKVDQPAEQITWGTLTLRSSSALAGRAVYDCSDTSADKFVNDGRCYAIKTAGMATLGFALAAMAVALALSVCVIRAFCGHNHRRPSDASARSSWFLSPLVPRLCTMQLLSLQALLLVWLVGGLESLLVGREDIRRSGVRELLSAPIPGISFVLTIIALVVAIPTSCFFTTEARRQLQLLAKAPQTIASPSGGIPSSSPAAAEAANGVLVEAPADVAVPVADDENAAAAESTADAEEADLEMPPPSASAVRNPSRLPTPPLSRPPEVTVRRRNSATPPEDVEEKHEQIDSIPIEHAAV